MSDAFIETVARAIKESVAVFDCGVCLTRGGDPHALDCKQAHRDRARAAIAAIEKAGYRIVPVEPTEAIKNALAMHMFHIEPELAYAAMLAAAPKVLP